MRGIQHIGIGMSAVLTHLLLEKMAAILMKSFVFWFEFPWSLFIRVQITIVRHWYTQWLGTEKAARHYLDQRGSSSPTHICGTRGRWVKYIDIQLFTCRVCYLHPILVLLFNVVPVTEDSWLFGFWQTLFYSAIISIYTGFAVSHMTGPFWIACNQL